MIDISALDVHWRGYPVTIVSDGVRDLLGPTTRTASADLLVLLDEAEDVARAGEPSGWLFRSHLAGEDIRIERFGGIRGADNHDGGAWSVYLPAER